jgi:hypothetical protein
MSGKVEPFPAVRFRISKTPEVDGAFPESNDNRPIGTVAAAAGAGNHAMDDRATHKEQTNRRISDLSGGRFILCGSIPYFNERHYYLHKN